MADYIDVLFYSLIGGVFSLIGGALLLSRQKTASSLARYGTPFAAGALLAASFFDLLPEAVENLEVREASLWILGGLILFFLLEHFIHWFHHTHEHEHDDEGHVAPLIIAGDTIHNLLDGIAIGAAFLIDVPTGIVTAIAVAAHEIPQEIGDFGLLLKSGYGRKKVLLVNGASALMSSVGALLTFWAGSVADLPLGQLLAVTAGMFIYIAASDIIPSIHAYKGKLAHAGVGMVIAGVLVVGLTTNIAHSYIDAGHGRGSEEHINENSHEGESYPPEAVHEEHHE